MKNEYRIRIEQDDSPESPREWSNLGTMVCWHNRYTLGDEQPSCGPMEWALSLAEEFEPGIEEKVERLDLDNHTRDVAAYQREKVDAILDRHVIMLPLYLYDHSGITMNTSGFSCSWDSGQVGWIWVSRKTVREAYDWKRITQARVKQIERILKAEVAVYAQYLEGDVHGFVLESRPAQVYDENGNALDVETEWEHEDSCWGFYGSDPFENGMADHINEEHHDLLREAA